MNCIYHKGVCCVPEDDKPSRLRCVRTCPLYPRNITNTEEHFINKYLGTGEESYIEYLLNSEFARMLKSFAFTAINIPNEFT